jgi:hypothetical protein
MSLPFLVRVLTSPRADFFGMPIGPSVGWGLWLLTLSSAVLAVASSVIAVQVTAALESSAPIGQAQNNWTQGWRWSAIAASAVIVLASVTYFSLNWKYEADIDDESKSSLPSFPSFTPPSFPSLTTPPFPSYTAAPPSTTTTVVSDAALGLACTDHDKIVFDPTSGQEIACMERFSPSYGWFWRASPPIEGVHERDTSCEGDRAWSISRTPDGYLIHCLPADIMSSSSIAGPGSLWRPPANV